MRAVPLDEFVRHCRHFLEKARDRGEAFVVEEDGREVARVLPGQPVMDAREALTDLYGCLPAGEGERWLADARRIADSLDQSLPDPWDS